MPPLPSNAKPRPPADFAPLLATDEPVLLVGGQAVNLWALYYEARTADLAPFVSRDVDVLGDRETLEALGKVAGTKPQFFPLRPPSNEVGVVIAKDGQGLPLLIEVHLCSLIKAFPADSADPRRSRQADEKLCGERSTRRTACRPSGCARKRHSRAS
jgi:hypothetical protein